MERGHGAHGAGEIEMSKKTDEAHLFSEEERMLLASVLDEIIPRSADGTFQGAGELGVGDYIEATLMQQPELEAVVARGLSTISASARTRNPDGFSALSTEERAALLREVEAEDPTFFGTLFLHAYIGYYTEPRVVECLGLKPHPQPDGYELEQGDLETLLQPVRQRSGKLYRDC
jgi:hypothetical protein